MRREPNDVTNKQNPYWDRETCYPDLWPIRSRYEVQKHNRDPNPLNRKSERIPRSLLRGASIDDGPKSAKASKKSGAISDSAF